VQREVIEVPGISEVSRKSGLPLSAAVRANGFIFVSGTPPIDRETGTLVRDSIAEQTERCLENLRHVLESAGSSLAKVCMVRIYASGDHYHTINGVYARFFPENPPARTFVPVGDWPMEFDLEIDCIALE
jgi:2-iminobutanoate/2-iminopropanoate deaminase